MNTSELETVEILNNYKKLLDIIHTLRSPQGCPWDREQTVVSLKGSLLEESLEVLQAIDLKDHNNLKEELGDVMLVVTLMSEIMEEQIPGFQNEILLTLNEKLIRRHPHVFSSTKVENSEEVVKQWDEIKALEKKKPKSLLKKIPKGFPPLEKAWHIQKEVSKVGFDWGTPEPVIEKVKEELQEVSDELKYKNSTNLEMEIGDLLFTAINLARVTGINPSLALEKSNNKFIKRFTYIEEKLEEANLSPGKEHFDLMETLWEQAKLKT